MKETYQPLFESVKLPNGVELKNRLVLAPMTIMASNPDDTVSDTEIAYYARRAKGLGLIVTASSKITEKGGSPGQLSIHSDRLIPGLSRLASAVHEQGAPVVQQIVHAGRKLPETVGEIVSASAVAEEKEGAPVPRALTEDEIHDMIRNFGEATRRAIEAGMDGVELHGANGYLLHQFFSSHSNRREDHWGGTLEKRMNFALAVIDEVKRVVREHAKRPFIVGYRLSPEEPETPGITMADTLAFADTLANQGLDYLHISLTDYSAVPRRGVDDNRPRLTLLQERVGDRVPVIGVGAIRTPDDALKALATGVPLIAVGRELIIEPDWVEKIAEGREQEIRTTISRNADRSELVIPDSLWGMILGVPGWFPVEE